MVKKVRELSVDFPKANKNESYPGFDFYVDSKENPTKLKLWVKKELEQNKVAFVEISVSRPIQEFTKPVNRSTISNYIKKMRE